MTTIEILIVIFFLSLAIGTIIGGTIYIFTKTDRPNFITIHHYRNCLKQATLNNIRFRTEETELVYRYYRLKVGQYKNKKR